jgi:hypothetical protein
MTPQNASGEGGGELRVLTLPLNGIYFDQIARGEKLEEYRLVTDFWCKRLEGKSFASLVLTRGYPKGGGVEGVTRLTRQWRGYSLRVIQHPHFGKDEAPVFVIDVSIPLNAKEIAGGAIDI